MMSDTTTASEARQALESTPCSLTAFISFAFILVGISTAILIIGLAVWLPVEIEKDGKTIKERNDLYFKANAKAES